MVCSVEFHQYGRLIKHEAVHQIVSTQGYICSLVPSAHMQRAYNQHFSVSVNGNTLDHDVNFGYNQTPALPNVRIIQHSSRPDV